MSYSVKFKVQVAGVESYYINVGEYESNITYNLRDMIVKSTGLLWENESDNGLVKDVIPYITKGLKALTKNPEKYEKYEPENGWGTIEGCIQFFQEILINWGRFIKEYPDLTEVVTFWIE